MKDIINLAMRAHSIWIGDATRSVFTGNIINQNAVVKSFRNLVLVHIETILIVRYALLTGTDTSIDKQTTTVPPPNMAGY